MKMATIRALASGYHGHRLHDHCDHPRPPADLRDPSQDMSKSRLSPCLDAPRKVFERESYRI